MNVIHYIPILTTILAAIYTVILFRHWSRKRSATYLLWWGIGVFMYGVGTLMESLTTLFGWNELVFRLWYVSGALLGGAPLAQGSVYLLLKSKRVAHIMTAVMLLFAAVAAVFVFLTPIDMSLVEETRLSGAVMSWTWVRGFSPFLNLYAFIFLVIGAVWSAILYWRQTHELGSRVIGNVAIAIGGLLPGIGGSFTRAGFVEVLYVTELIGIIFIWLGYYVMVTDSTFSIHRAQRLASRSQAEN